MFPGPYAHVYDNEAGEPLGWDNTYYDEPPELDDEYWWAHEMEDDPEDDE